MKLLFVTLMALVLGTYAGSPSYSETSSDMPSSSSGSSGFICDTVREIIKKLTSEAIEKIKDWIRNRIKGRSDEENSSILIEACEYLKSSSDVSENDKEVCEVLLNLNKVDQKSEFGFDLDSAWECLKEIFSDLFSQLDSSDSSGSIVSSEYYSSS